MNILDMILNSQGGGVNPVDEIAGKFNLPPGQAKSAISELLGPLTQGLQKNLSTPGGLDGLVDALGKGNHREYVDRPETLTQESTTNDGNKILGHIFGSKEVSRQVAGEASRKTGIDPEILKKMLPIVAAVVMGQMSKKTSTTTAPSGGGGIVDVLTSLLGGGSSSGSRSSGGMGGLLGGLLGKLFRR